MTANALDLLIRPRDPIVARTGSPFTADPGAQATTLDWPLPGTIAGAIRTHLLASQLVSLNGLSNIAVTGGFLVERTGQDDAWDVCFPSPRDAVIYTPNGRNDLAIRRLRPAPLQAGAGCNLPSTPGDLLPIAIDIEEKAATGYDYWSFRETVNWLLEGDLPSLPRQRGHLPKETRVHVSIDPATGTARDGHLFQTSGIVFSPGGYAGTHPRAEQGILCRVTPSDLIDGAVELGQITLGGERRQAFVKPLPEHNVWSIPDELLSALTGKTRLRLQLVTPGIFRTGWFPGWQTHSHHDRKPPALKRMKWTLRSAVVGRRIPVSGWVLNKNQEKRLRYAAPAGSVFFYETPEPLEPEQIRQLWLCSISDSADARRDGFGLVLPGVWKSDHEEGLQ